MEQNALNETLALRKWNLCPPFGQLMNERTTIGTLGHDRGKVITATVPCNLFDCLEMGDDQTETGRVIITFGCGPLNGCANAVTFDGIDFRGLLQNFIGLLGEHLITNGWIQKNQS